MDLTPSEKAEWITLMCSRANALRDWTLGNFDKIAVVITGVSMDDPDFSNEIEYISSKYDRRLSIGTLYNRFDPFNKQLYLMEWAKDAKLTYDDAKMCMKCAVLLFYILDHGGRWYDCLNYDFDNLPDDLHVYEKRLAGQDVTEANKALLYDLVRTRWNESLDLM